MNFIRKGFSLLSTGIRAQCTQLKAIPYPATACPIPSSPTQPMGLLARAMASLNYMHKTGPHIKKRKSKNPLKGNPFAKGVVLKTVIKKPKKPNSANRKCVLVRLSNGKEMVSYVPGIGHNLQEHNIVLVRVGRLKDCPGVKLKCVRGKYDLPHVVKQKDTVVSVLYVRLEPATLPVIGNAFTSSAIERAMTLKTKFVGTINSAIAPMGAIYRCIIRNLLFKVHYI